MDAQKRQLTIEGVLIDGPSFIDCRPPLLIKEELFGGLAQSVHDGVPIGTPYYTKTEKREHYRADFGSRVVQEAMAPYKNHWINGFYQRLCEVLAKNREYIMGEKGMNDIHDTAEDRRLVDALAAGASMDPHTGIIEGFDREID